jgi:metallo-beta-lactamase family protein
MASKNKDIEIRFLGKSSTEVTGSLILVECPTGEKILLDCGLHQSLNIEESYRINSQKFDFKPSEISCVIISHLNIDHLGLVPRLFAEGANCPVFMYYPNIDLVPIMLEDSVRILEREATILTKKLKKIVMPIYNIDDLNATIPYLRGCDKNKIIQVTENVSFKLVSAGHIFGSTQILLYVKSSNGQVKTIGYSGDVGNILFKQPFVEDFEPITKCNIFIGECTYNNADRSVKKEARQKDLDLLQTVIKQTIEDKGIVLIPCFALQRIETILYILWELYHNNKNFKTKIIIDSPLAIKIINELLSNLENDDLKLLHQILEWENVQLITEFEESQLNILDTQPKIILSSSGMLTQGRSVQYLKAILPRKNCAVITCGYMAEGSLGWKIKNLNDEKTIKIGKDYYKNKCSIHSLKSFSAHMQYEQLINYYTNLANNGCNIICLVHSDKEKLEFKKKLDESIRRINKTTKVVAVNSTTIKRI